MKLDPEGPVIADALEQTEVKEANERGAGAWIEFTPDGCAKVTITISRELELPSGAARGSGGARRMRGG